MPERLKVNLAMLSWVFQQRNWPKKFLVYVPLCYLPVVNLLIMGYLMKVMESSLLGRGDLPEWTDIGDMALLALQQLVIIMVYSSVIMIPGYVLCLVLFLAGFIFSRLLGIASFVLFFLALIIFIYLIVFVALVHFVDRRGLGDAFNVIKIWEVFRRTFGQLSLLALLLLATSAGILAFLSLVLVMLLDYKFMALLFLLFGPLNFWINCTFFHFGTKICMDANPALR